MGEEDDPILQKKNVGTCDSKENIKISQSTNVYRYKTEKDIIGL